MKKITFAALLSVASFVGIHAQNVGVGTDAPTQKLDVNGTLRVRTLDKVNYPNGDKVVTHKTDGTFTHTPALDVLYSTGLYVKGKNSWENLLVGSAARIDFTGRLSLLFLDVSFSFLYKPNVGFIFPPSSNILISSKPESVSLTQVSASVFRLTIKMSGKQPFSYDFTFTYSNSNNKVTITKSGGGEWAKGTFVSTPNLEPGS